jgi:hypothetical protein
MLYMQSGYVSFEYRAEKDRRRQERLPSSVGARIWVTGHTKVASLGKEGLLASREPAASCRANCPSQSIGSVEDRDAAGKRTEVKETGMAISRYRRIADTDASAHDKKLNELEISLLDGILNADYAAEARDYAEAYALIRGHLTGINNVEVKTS